MDGSIRLAPGTKSIEVNDNGDCITIKIGDAAFNNDLINLVVEAQHIADKLEAATPGDLYDTKSVADFTSETAKSCAEVCEKIDRIFNDNVCQKVFGDRTPDLYSISDFICQLAALVRKFEGERRNESRQRIAKYTAKYQKKAGESK